MADRSTSVHGTVSSRRPRRLSDRFGHVFSVNTEFSSLQWMLAHLRRNALKPKYLAEEY